MCGGLKKVRKHRGIISEIGSSVSFSTMFLYVFSVLCYVYYIETEWVTTDIDGLLTPTTPFAQGWVLTRVEGSVRRGGS